MERHVSLESPAVQAEELRKLILALPYSSIEYNAFFAELARFPPAPGGAFPASVTGEALGEKEVDDENDGMDMKDEPWSGHGLEEFNAPREAEEETVEETLFDPDDDIVD